MLALLIFNFYSLFKETENIPFDSAGSGKIALQKIAKSKLIFKTQTFFAKIKYSKVLDSTENCVKLRIERGVVLL